MTEQQNTIYELYVESGYEFGFHVTSDSHRHSFAKVVGFGEKVTEGGGTYWREVDPASLNTLQKSSRLGFRVDRYAISSGELIASGLTLLDTPGWRLY